MTDPNLDNFPQMLTEEEAEQKANMMKASREVAEAVTELRDELVKSNWNIAEQAALTLFNTMLMTAFGEGMRQSADKRKEAQKEFRAEIEERALKQLKKRGFGDTEINKSCISMLLDHRPEAQVGAVWEDFYGDGTKGVLFAAVKKVNDDYAEELEKKGKS